jgi:hypothetical protein
MNAKKSIAPSAIWSGTASVKLKVYRNIGVFSKHALRSGQIKTSVPYRLFASKLMPTDRWEHSEQPATDSPLVSKLTYRKALVKKKQKNYRNPNYPLLKINSHVINLSPINDRKAGAFGAFILNKETKNKKDKSW